MIGELPESCDVAVIGAGVGGLTAAGLLAKAGLQVCVVDREARVGGYLAGFNRKKFTFDTAIHWLNQCGPGGIVSKVFRYLGPDAPNAPLLRRIRRYRGDSFDYLLTNNPDELKAQFIHDFPEDANGIRRFFVQAKIIGERMTGLTRFARSRETFTPWDWIRVGLPMAFWGIPFMRYMRDKNGEKLGTFFTNPKLRAIFCSEENILSCLVPIGWAYTGDFQLPPAGGSQAFPQWLTRLIRSLGSRVVLRAGVDQVMMENGRASGVRLENGKQVRARWVIAACDIETLYTRMLPSGVVPPKRIDELRTADLYPSCVSISVGLDCEPAALGLSEELIFLTRDGIPREAHNNGDPHTVGLSILAPSLRDPTLAPPGKGTLTIYASAPLTYGDNWKTEPGFERGEAYKAFKNEYADILLERVEAVAPDLRKHIELLSIATPLTHLRYTGNRSGTIMGQVPSYKNMRMGVATHRTPVKNVLIGGHWAQYGGGVPIAVRAASNAALLILRDEKPAAYAQLRDLLDGRGQPATAVPSLNPA
jgi:phytoene dehydrogenase-like protein